MYTPLFDQADEEKDGQIQRVGERETGGGEGAIEKEGEREMERQGSSRWLKYGLKLIFELEYLE